MEKSTLNRDRPGRIFKGSRKLGANRVGQNITDKRRLAVEVGSAGGGDSHKACREGLGGERGTRTTGVRTPPCRQPGKPTARLGLDSEQNAGLTRQPAHSGTRTLRGVARDWLLRRLMRLPSECAPPCLRAVDAQAWARRWCVRRRGAARGLQCRAQHVGHAGIPGG